MVAGHSVVVIAEVATKSHEEPQTSPVNHSSPHFVRLRVCPAAIAFAAGAVGMTLQMVWLRYSAQWFGTSAITVAAVLATALAGLAIGAFSVAAGQQKAAATSLRAAGSSLLTASFFVVLDWGLAWWIGVSDVWQNLLFDQRLLSLAVVTVVAMLPVNIFLGRVLPLLTRNEGLNSIGICAATAYAWETLGAAAGSLISGVWLIHTVGLSISMLACAAGGSCLALAGRWLMRRSSVGDQHELSDSTAVDSKTGGSFSFSRFAVAVFLAGVASMGMEIIWQRLLILIIGTDVLSYTVVVVAYLVGVSLGSIVADLRWKRGSELRTVENHAYFLIQLGLALMTLAALFVFVRLTAGSTQEWLADNRFLFDSPLVNRFVLCFILLLMPTILIGAGFPVAVRLLQRNDPATQRATAVTCMWIAAGNVVGAVVSAMLLIPWLGLQATLVVLGWLAIAAGCLSLPKFRIAYWLTAAVGVSVGIVFLSQMKPLGVGRLPDRYEVRWYREGPANTVTVFSDNSDPDRLKMSVDGIVIGESGGGVDEKQQMLAQLPFVLRTARADATGSRDQSGNDRVLTIGLGTGILAGRAASITSVGDVSCVELSPAVIAASQEFADLNGDLNNNSSVQIVQGDGIHFLRTCDHQFDAIISDGKSRPGHAGNVAFFSREYYQLAKARLSDGGIFIQWFSLQASADELKVVLKTLANVFDHAAMAIAAPDSVYLLASHQPLHLEKPILESAVDSVVSDSLRTYGWRTADDFRSMGWLDINQMALHLDESTGVNRLTHPVLERYALDLVHQSTTVNRLNNLRFLRACLKDERIDSLIRKSSGRMAAIELLDLAVIQTMAAADWFERSMDHVGNAIRQLPELTKGEPLADQLLLAANQFLRDNHPDAAVDSLVKASRLCRSDATRQAVIGRRLLQLNHPELAVDCFSRARRLQPNRASHHIAFARCLVLLNKHRAAISPLQQAVKLEPNDPATHLELAEVASAVGLQSLARQHRERAAELAGEG